MRYIPAALQTMLNGTEITPAFCLKITRKDGVVVAFTTHDADLVVSGVTYKSKASFTPSAIKWSNRIEDNNAMINGLIDVEFLGSTILAEDLRIGVYSNATYIYFLTDWTNTANITVLKEGKIASVVPNGTEYNAELRNMFAPIVKTPIVQACAIACNAELGDARCGFALGADTGTIDYNNSMYELGCSTFTYSGPGDPEVELVGGVFQFTSGDYTWFKNQIKSYDDVTKLFTLVRPFPQVDEPFWDFRAYEGCPKTFAACRDRFNNIVNFRGFPHVPTKNKTMKGSAASTGDNSGYGTSNGGD